jgi:hypothetical protein
MKRRIVFTHIPKTAGTSFKEDVIKKNYPQVFNLRGKISLLKVFLERPYFLSGHVPFGPINRYMKNQYEHLTFFRDPIERGISHYFFILESKTEDYVHPQYQVCKKYSLEEIYSTGGLPDNLQTRYLAGCHKKHVKCTGHMLTVAKENLEKFYPVFGIQEHYDASVEIICKYYDLRLPKKEKKSFYKKTYKKPEIDQRTRNILASQHEFDRDLYEFALEKFDQMREQVGLIPTNDTIGSKEM